MSTSETIPYHTIYIGSGSSNVIGTTSNFSQLLAGSPLLPVPGKTMRIAVTSATIPLTYYGVNSTNDRLNITETLAGVPTTFNVTLIDGQYSSVTFGTMVGSQMTAASLASGNTVTYTATVSTDTGLITIASSSATVTTVINYAASTASVPLGLPATGTSAGFLLNTPFVSPGIINIAGPREFNIRCGNVSVNVYETRTQNPAAILAIIPIVGNQFESVIYIPAYPKMFGEVGSKLDRLDIQITDENGSIVNLNGFAVQIQLAIYLVENHW